MRPRAQQAVWESWAPNHTGFMDGEDLKFGYSAIFGRLPSKSDPNYTRFYDA